MIDPPPVAKVLTKMQMPHRVFTHSGPVRSLEQAASERGQRPEQVVRSLLFRLSSADDENKERFVMVLVAGPDQISWSALRRVLGENRLTTASKEEVLSVTGYPIGAVSPIGNPQPIPVWLDESVLAQTEISIGSGLRGTTVIMAVADLLTLLGNVPVARLTASRQTDARPIDATD